MPLPLIAILFLITYIFARPAMKANKRKEKERAEREKAERLEAERCRLRAEELRRAEEKEAEAAEEEAERQWMEAAQEARHKKVIARASEYERAFPTLPMADIAVDAAKGKTQRVLVSDMAPVRYTNVTSRSNLKKLSSFVVIDTETNGIKMQGMRVLELSAIRYEDFQPVEAWTTLVNPGTAIPAEATEINHITNEMVSTAPTLAQVKESFLRFVGESAIVGYNLSFDLKVLYSRGIDLVNDERRFYDAWKLTRKAFADDLERFRLQDFAKHCGLTAGEAHRSLWDCFVTGFAFAECVRRIKEAPETEMEETENA